MKKSVLAVLASAAMLVAVPAGAQQTKAPGQQMQDKGSVKGTTGASGYTPGHKMQDKGSVKGTTGASGYAPGHADQKSGANSRKH
ncbi:hypothetical protein [Afipia sp. Root123D2]|uniref:hypothetical protein n=1 Tax=Afipia sp. Root123D2 TaxID=1736436 RepID=UPI0009EBC665|nr:hypothetical protein [Afipia sp. Root123D2]